MDRVDDALESVAVAEQQIRYWQARQQHALAELAHARRKGDLTPVGLHKHYVREEVSCALRVSPDSARVRIATATAAEAHFPELLKLLEAGETSLAHLLTFADAVRPLEPDQTRALLDLVHEKARVQAIVAFRQSVARALLVVRPVAEEKNRQLAVEQRRVAVRHTMAGMSDVFATLPTEGAVALAAAVEALAMQWSSKPGETRSMPQLRADALVHLTTGGQGASGSISVNVCVTADAVTGASEQPGELSVPLPAALGGRGVPIGAEHARRLAFAECASWRRFVTDERGQLLEYGRSTYRPPAALAEFVRARDRTCTFPHCTRPAIRCDIDHRQPWQVGGTTGGHNCDCLCERHHYLKHNTSWAVTRLADGTRQWTSPAGHVYERPPETYPVEPMPVEPMPVDYTPDDPLFRELRAPAAPAPKTDPEPPPPF